MCNNNQPTCQHTNSDTHNTSTYTLHTHKREVTVSQSLILHQSSAIRKSLSTCVHKRSATKITVHMRTVTEAACGAAGYKKSLLSVLIHAHTHIYMNTRKITVVMRTAAAAACAGCAGSARYTEITADMCTAAKAARRPARAPHRAARAGTGGPAAARPLL